MAEKYKDKIPDYKISSGKGKFHAGVIIDNPSYTSYNAEEPPPAFVNMGVDVELNDNQINSKMGSTAAYDKRNKYNINRMVDIEDSHNQFNLNDKNLEQLNQGYSSNNKQIQIVDKINKSSEKRNMFHPKKKKIKEKAKKKNKE